MNDSCLLYLNTYGWIDTFDSLVKKSFMYYQSWKYWYQEKLHGGACVGVVAYDLYYEVATKPKAREFFGITPDNNFKVLDFHEFWDKLSKQSLLYKPDNCLYLGDNRMCVNAQLKKNIGRFLTIMVIFSKEKRDSHPKMK